MTGTGTTRSADGTSDPILADRLLRRAQGGGGPLGLLEHLRLYGPMPSVSGRRSARSEVIDLVERAGLCGRGGAGFPVARKMRAVLGERAVGANRRPPSRTGTPIVVANGCEGEPASAKDRVLLAYRAHLVLDGAVFAAGAVGADEVIVVTHASLAGPVEAALAERIAAGTDPIPIAYVPAVDRFIAGQESALVSHLNGGPGLPTLVPPRPFERGVDGRPTLIHNVETLAHLALIARHGAAWYRQIGSPEEPGSTLVTVRGVVGRPGVYEIPRGTPIGRLLSQAGGLQQPLQALLVGGYAGAWIGAAAIGAGLSETSLRAVQGTLGAGVVIAAGSRECGIATTARILSYLADQTAGQCGPCLHGLAAMAETMSRLAVGEARRDSVERLHAWAWQVSGRGACHHPDGAARLGASALTVFASDVEQHRYGRPCAGALQPTWNDDDLPGTAAFVPQPSRQTATRRRW